MGVDNCVWIFLFSPFFLCFVLDFWDSPALVNYLAECAVRWGGERKVRLQHKEDLSRLL